MNGPQRVMVCPLTDDLVGDVVDIHLRALGYTVNSRLGRPHLTFLYQHVARDEQSYVGVAMVESRPAGIVSGTLNEDRLKSGLMRSMPARRLAGIAAQLLVRPWPILQWLQTVVIALPVYHQQEEVLAVLTALAVDPNYQGHGVGRQLVAALEVFFSANRVRNYRLDTLVTNHQARKFYGNLGFREVARRAGSVILVRAIGP